MRSLSAYLLFCAAAFAQPGIRQNGVVNTASQIPPSLAGGAIARGAPFTIYGIRLGAAGHTSLTVSQVAATLVKVDPKRIDALMPATAPVGKAMLVVTVDGLASKPFPLEIVNFNPGFFSRNGEGWGPGRIDNLSASGARTANSTAAPAQPAQRIAIAAAGLGDRKSVTVVIGNRVIAGVDRAPHDELIVRIPADVAPGCFVPVYAMASPARASNVVTVSIRAGKGACDSGPVPLFTSQNVAVAAISRTRMQGRTLNAPDQVADDARISFYAAATEPALSPIRLLPPPGACTAYTSSFQSQNELSTSLASIVGPEGRGRSAGARLTLTRTDGMARPIGEGMGNPGSYRARLGSAGTSDRRAPPLFLDPGAFVLEGSGGGAIGAFRAAFDFSAPFEWILRDQAAIVDRARGVRLQWKGNAPGRRMLIVARNVDQITTAIGMCLCVPPAGAQQFEIPPAILANVPISRELPGVPFDELVIASLPARAVAFSAAGLAGGVVVPIYASGRIVSYR